MNAIGGPCEAATPARASSCARSRRATSAARSAPRCPTCSPPCKAAGFDLVIVETSGIGQGDAAIVPLVDVPVYVMTPEFGAASQLEKIDMLDFAEFVAINKFDRKGAADALRDVAKQVQRNRQAFGQPPEQMPVFGTVASRFNDDGVTALYQALVPRLAELGLALERRQAAAARDAPQHAPGADRARPRARATSPRSPTRCARTSARRSSRRALAREVQQLRASGAHAERRQARASARRGGGARPRRRARGAARHGARGACSRCGPRCRRPTRATSTSSRSATRRSAPRSSTRRSRAARSARSRCRAYEDHGEILRWLLLDNVPGSFPYTAGTFAFKREDEDPTRMFAGEGDAFRTNRASSCSRPACRPSACRRRSTRSRSTATTRRCRPDIYGKVGNSGVSIATLDDMKVLYSGFDLTRPGHVGLSMTINGPAPTILAMFMNTAIDQKLDKFVADNGREPTDDEAQKIRAWVQGERARHGAGRHPEGGPGPEHLHLLDRVLAEGDGRHRRVLRAPPGPQLLLGLDLRLPHRRGRREPDQRSSRSRSSNGFTFVEAYLARGMNIDDFAPNLSFFF